MYLLSFLKDPQCTQSAKRIAVEYRLLCSGELYNGDIIAIDWRKSDVT
jgi:hypothetical protein